MSRGFIQIYCGEGKGKTFAAVGQGIREASQGKSVIMIQFLKGNGEGLKNNEVLARLEPEIKCFSFEKADCFFADLSEEEKQEEIINIKNGLNFAKKVLVTGECDVLILDELLGLLDYQIITVEELKALLESGNENMTLVLTGRYVDEEICAYADEVSKIEHLK